MEELNNTKLLKDKFGYVINIGDMVAFATGKNKDLTLDTGIVDEFVFKKKYTLVKIKVEVLGDNGFFHEERISRFPEQVIINKFRESCLGIDEYVDNIKREIADGL